MLTFAALFAMTCAHAVSQRVSHICVYNDAAFVLKWKLHSNADGADSSDSHAYSLGQVECMGVASSGLKASAGSTFVPKVKAILGREVTASPSVAFDPAIAASVTYVCRGTTLRFSCKVGPPPPTAENVTKDVGDFLLGFVEGLGMEIGFGDCLKDLNVTFQQGKAVVQFFETGFNRVTIQAVVKALELLGQMLEDFSAAIASCVKDSAAFAAKMKSLAAALSGNPLNVVKVLADEAVHVWHDRKEISNDCKAVVADWHAGDYKGSGKAVGDITGELLNGLHADTLVVV